MSMNNSTRLGLAWLGILLLLAVTSWFGWKALRDSKPEAAGAAPAQPPSTVIVKPVVERSVVEFLEVTGTLRAVRRSEVAARESAAVESIEVEEGDRVERGAVIATLDARRLAAQLEEASATLTAAEAELAQREAERERAVQDEDMMRGLWEERAVAERDYLDSLREMKVAEARENAAGEAISAATKRLDLLKVRQQDLAIKAPFDGEVVARHAELGEWLNEGDPVVTLSSTGEVEAWLQLPERHASLLRHTAPESVTMRIPGNSEEIRADRLSLVSDVDGRSRRFVLIAHIPDPDNSLTPGSSVRAQVSLGKAEPRLVIDADAVLKSYAGTYVFVPEPGEGGPPLSRQVPVEVLFERDGESVVRSEGLKPGSEVIVEGNERLFPNTPLDPRPWAETRGEKAAAANQQPVPES